MKIFVVLMTACVMLLASCGDDGGGNQAQSGQEGQEQVAGKQETREGVPPDVQVVGRTSAPGGGEWVVGANGEVYAVGGAPFYGSYPKLMPEQRLGERSFTGIEASPGGGYTLISNIPGQTYTFNPTKQ
jgi:hypothetical protein